MGGWAQTDSNDISRCAGCGFDLAKEKQELAINQQSMLRHFARSYGEFCYSALCAVFRCLSSQLERTVYLDVRIAKSSWNCLVRDSSPSYFLHNSAFHQHVCVEPLKLVMFSVRGVDPEGRRTRDCSEQPATEREMGHLEIDRQYISRQAAQHLFALSVEDRSAMSYMWPLNFPQLSYVMADD